jgi:hypothetical protein
MTVRLTGFGGPSTAIQHPSAETDGPDRTDRGI